MKSRTTGGINLGLTENIEETHKSLSLRTGDVIARGIGLNCLCHQMWLDQLTELTNDELQCNKFYEEKKEIESDENEQDKELGQLNN